MYKNFINKAVEARVQQNIMDAQKQAKQRRIENAKYNSSNLLVGYISKVVDDGSGKLIKMTSATPRVFVRVNSMLQDIETSNKYPLYTNYKVAQQNTPCVIENDVQTFVSSCFDAFNTMQMEYDVILSKSQVVDVLKMQSKINDFNI